MMNDVVYDIDIDVGDCVIIQNDKKYVGKITRVWKIRDRYDLDIIGVEEVEAEVQTTLGDF